MVPLDAEPQRGGRAGLHEMGLPYVSDPAITRHLASFLKDMLADKMASAPAPRQHSLQRRRLSTRHLARPRRRMCCATGTISPQQPWQPLVLTNPSLDLAVAWGAAHFAWLKHTGGRRIGGGIARSYYVGIRNEADRNRNEDNDAVRRAATPGRGPGDRLDKPELELALGQPVLFPLIYFNGSRRRQGGRRAASGPDATTATAALAHDSARRQTERHARRSGHVGGALHRDRHLELYCVAKEGNNRWRLEFNVRDIVKESDDKTLTIEKRQPRSPMFGPKNRSRKQRNSSAQRILSRHQGDPKQLTKALEAILDAGRDKWPTGFVPAPVGLLAEVAEQRRVSPGHLARWYNLVGFCLRPGFGAPHGQVPRGTTVEAIARAPTGDRQPLRWTRQISGASRGRRGFLDHVAPRRRRP